MSSFTSSIFFMTFPLTRAILNPSFSRRSGFEFFNLFSMDSIFIFLLFRKSRTYNAICLLSIVMAFFLVSIHRKLLYPSMDASLSILTSSRFFVMEKSAGILLARSFKCVLSDKSKLLILLLIRVFIFSSKET